jgi:hypothetical protein
MITNNDLPIELVTLAGGTYPAVRVALNELDAFDGVSISFIANALEGSTTSVDVVALSTGEEDISANVAGNTYYDVNTGALASKKMTTLTMNFTTYVENLISIKPGTLIGAYTFPSVLPPQIAFVFESTTLNLKTVRMSRRNHPAAI